MYRRVLASVSILALAACADGEHPAAPSSADLASGRPGSGPGALYVASNNASANALMRFPRSADGQLGAPVPYATGGLGTGAGLGNQGGIAFAREGRLVYVVNAGSDEISGFAENGSGLTLVGTWPSSGDLPVSIAIHRGLLYVLNDGGPTTVAGFTINSDGSLAPIAGSGRTLDQAAMVDAAQVGFSPDGEHLVITEKATNLLVTFPVMPDGTLGAATTTPSAGMTPFGFAFNAEGMLFVSEAFGGTPGASAVSSYGNTVPGWSPISPSAATTETAACWVAITPNQRYAYTTNTGSASVSGYAIGADGSLTLLNPDGVTGVTGAGPIDMDITRSSRLLYTLNAAGQSISAFQVGEDGSLTPIGEFTGLPAGSNGLVVR